MIEEILETLLRTIVLDEEDTFKNRELVECRWKDNLTFSSVYWVISLIWTFGFGSYCGSGYVTLSRIQSFERVTSFHWIALGTTVFDLEMSVWNSKVLPLCDWNVCVCVCVYWPSFRFYPSTLDLFRIGLRLFHLLSIGLSQSNDMSCIFDILVQVVLSHFSFMICSFIFDWLKSYLCRLFLFLWLFFFIFSSYHDLFLFKLVHLLLLFIFLLYN